MAEMEKAVCRGRDMKSKPQSPLAAEGVEECGIVNLADTADGFPAGPIRGGWQHGFALRQLRIAAGTRTPAHTRLEPEVVFVHEGELTVCWPEGKILMQSGDTFSVPVGVARKFENRAAGRVVAYVVRGGDNPGAPQFGTSAESG